MTTLPLAHRSHAVVATDRAGRYAKQLLGHLGRRLETSLDDAGGLVVFPGGAGRCRLVCRPEALEMYAEAADPDTHRRVEDVVGRHLEKFGARDELAVVWRPAATAG